MHFIAIQAAARPELLDLLQGPTLQLLQTAVRILSASELDQVVSDQGGDGRLRLRRSDPGLVIHLVID